MKRVILTLMVLSLFLLGGQSFADLCAIDAVPAATLLLPVFKTDISDNDGDGTADCSGIDTLFSINNASAAPTLAHVTLWTDWSFPTLDFDVYLTGFDMQSVSLCQVIGRGNLPVTADVQADPNDTISPSGWGEDITFPTCAGFFPFPEPIVTGALLDRVQNGHAGYSVATLGGDCVGEQLNGAGACAGGSCPAGTIARGYVTVDSVSACSTIFPNEPNYFQQGGGGIANNNNILWGDWFKIDRENNFASGDNLVHIEADASLGGGAGNGADNNATGYTFYGRYTFPGGGDNREPLGTTWAARYLNGGAFNGGTKFSVWRDSTDATADPGGAGFACGICIQGAGPFWCPLDETQVVCFDEEENCESLCGGIFGPPVSPPDFDEEVCFPLESNHVQVGVAPLDPSTPFGWCFLNLNQTLSVPPGFPGGAPWGPGGGPIAQSYVSVSHDALGLFSVGYAAIELTSACSTADPVIIVGP
jgi:hypothetical protein